MSGIKLSKAMKPIVDLKKCYFCGITNLDGAPEANIPYPVVIEREEAGNEVLCDECLKIFKEEQKGS